MKLSTRGRYATRALLELALHDSGGLATLKEIAQRQNISLRYLEHLITPLIAAGLVRTTRGPRGGISLAKAPGEIKLSEVIQLLEGSIAPVECVDNPTICQRADSCATRDVWCQVKKAVTTVLDSVTLADLVECHKKKSPAEQTTYYV
jgi:Rrf2 family cysteine metabolism transcriptional repressor